MERICAAAVLFSFAAITPSHADVNEGLAAYKAGDYGPKEILDLPKNTAVKLALMPWRNSHQLNSVITCYQG